MKLYLADPPVQGEKYMIALVLSCFPWLSSCIWWLLSFFDYCHITFEYIPFLFDDLYFSSIFVQRVFCDKKFHNSYYFTSNIESNNPFIAYFLIFKTKCEYQRISMIVIINIILFKYCQQERSAIRGEFILLEEASKSLRPIKVRDKCNGKIQILILFEQSKKMLITIIIYCPSQKYC